MSDANSKNMYRSLEELEDSPEFKDFLNREFPTGAEDAPDGVTRRRWIQLMGASAVLAGVSGCRFDNKKITPLSFRPEDRVPGETRTFATTIEWAGNVRPLFVTSYDGRPIKADGSAIHPLTTAKTADGHNPARGVSDSVTQACVLDLYDPDRSRGCLEKVDRDFAEHARKTVQRIAPEVDWTHHKEAEGQSLAQAKAWLNDHPANYQAMTNYARLAIAAEEFEAAEEVLLQLQEMHPEDRDASGTLALLGRVYRQTGQTEKEVAVLSQLARLNDRALEVYARLASLHASTGNWDGVYEASRRFLAVQPMLPFGHEQIGLAAEQLDRPADLALSLSALLEMDPVDPAEVHYRIAKARQETGEKDIARRQVLMALEYAPRYREAQRLLLNLVQPERNGD